MTSISLALDWIPNPIHTGFYVAQAKGWYAEAGIEVKFISPEEDGYQKLPVQRLEEGEVQLAICPSEFVIKSHYLGGEGKLVAIAALLQQSPAAMVTLKDSGITRPRELDDKRYALYGLPFEHNILSRMIYMDGGTGITTNIETPKLETWQRVLNGDADCTFVFKPIEGVEAQHKGVEVNLFDLHEYGVPYGYAPVLVTHKDLLDDKEETLRKFMQAATRGYHFATQNPAEAARLLLQEAQFTTKPNEDLTDKMQHATSRYYLTLENNWGAMEGERWHGFIEWLEEQRLLTIAEHMPSHLRGTMQEVVFTNRFIVPDSYMEV